MCAELMIVNNTLDTLDTLGLIMLITSLFQAYLFIIVFSMLKCSLRVLKSSCFFAVYKINTIITTGDYIYG